MEEALRSSVSNSSTSDNSFDDLDVPENWLELGTKRRNEDPDHTVDKRLKSNSQHTPIEGACSTTDTSYLITTDDEDYMIASALVAHSKQLQASEKVSSVRKDANITNHLTRPSRILTVTADSSCPKQRHTDILGENVRDSLLEEKDCTASKLSHQTPKDNSRGADQLSSLSDDPPSDSFLWEEFSMNEPEFNTTFESQDSCSTSEDQSINQPERVLNSTSVTANNETFETFEDESINQPVKEPLIVNSKSEANGSNVDLIVLDESNVSIYTEELTFTDDELQLLSADPKLAGVGNQNTVTNSLPRNPGPLDDSNKSKLRKVASIVRDAKIISSIVPDRSFNEIYDALLENEDNNNRLDIVTVQLLEKPPSSNQNAVLDIFQEVELVVSAVPWADANFVYALLEALPPSGDRFKRAIAQISPGTSTNHKPSLLTKTSSTNSVDDPILKDDPIFADMRTIAKMFPDKDRNEIYALLEANHNKDNRLQSVICELMQQQREDSQQILPQPSLPQDNLNRSLLNEVELFDQDIHIMESIFPDCDPSFLVDRLSNMMNDPNRTDMLAIELFEKKNYPKKKDLEDNLKRKEREQLEQARKTRVRNLDFTVEEFLERFPDPEKTFGDLTTQKSRLYQDHANIALKNEFRMLKAGYLRNVFIKNNLHFYPAYRQLSEEILRIPLDQRGKFNNRFMKYPRGYKIPMPPEADDYFYHEYWFVQNEQTVKDYPKQKEEAKRALIEEAKLKGELFECGCCYDDECLFSDLTSCPDGHLFCKTCVIRSTEAAFGEMKTKFPCLTGCEQNIPLSTLQTVIPANLFSKIVRRMQEEEVLAANITDLVTCPFCPFATIMPNPDDKVFKCLNPECLKESCRLCQEPNHIPLRCNEVEKKAETNMRTFIENQISEAVMRKCHKCGKRFVKETGCNKMTCICGATSCYACKAQNVDYNHFNRNEKCSDTAAELLHLKDMKAAAVKAKEEYLRLHPEASDIQLKTDVDEMIKEYQESTAKVKNIPMIGPGGYLGRQYGGNW